MAIGNHLGQFNFSVTSSTYERQAGGGSTVAINIEGPATGYGQVSGTMTLSIAGTGVVSGAVTYTGAAFLDTGETLGATGEGYWGKLHGEHRWRIRGINMNTRGETLLSDGTLDLATRTYNGALIEWT